MAETVLVTGVSGFIARRVALDLLLAGYQVRGTVRQAGAEEAVRTSLAKAGADTSRLSFATADLTRDDGWPEAVKGCRYVQHIASPFPLQQPKERHGLVPAAREGALRVLTAALEAGAERIVMTSSIVAMMYRSSRPAVMTFGEEDWTDPDWPPISPYIVSKTLAERAAWDHMKARGAAEKLTVVNPGFVLGPLLDGESSTSTDVIGLFLKRVYPAIPPTAFPIVDVRDLSQLHVKAMIAPGVGGRRLIGAGETLTMPAMAKLLREELGEAGRRVPRMELPVFAVRLLALFDPAVRSLIPDIGCKPVANSAYVTELTGVAFRPARESVIATGRSLVEQGLVA